MREATTKTKAKQPTKAELLQQLAETEKLARPATATPPPEGLPAVWPDKVGCMHVWLCVRDDRGQTEAYKLRLIAFNRELTGWELQKLSDGTRYHLHEAWEPEEKDRLLWCDCPGAVAHGPKCNGGRGCKHARMLKALRQVVDPGV